MKIKFSSKKCLRKNIHLISSNLLTSELLKEIWLTKKEIINLASKEGQDLIKLISSNLLTLDPNLSPYKIENHLKHSLHTQNSHSKLKGSKKNNILIHVTSLLIKYYHQIIRDTMQVVRIYLILEIWNLNVISMANSIIYRSTIEESLKLQAVHYFELFTKSNRRWSIFLWKRSSLKIPCAWKKFCF